MVQLYESRAGNPERAPRVAAPERSPASRSPGISVAWLLGPVVRIVPPVGSASGRIKVRWPSK